MVRGEGAAGLGCWRLLVDVYGHRRRGLVVGRGQGKGGQPGVDRMLTKGTQNSCSAR